MTNDEHYLYERYLGPDRRSRTRDAYYAVKPLLPRRLQLALRRAYAPAQARRQFPAWPIEPVLVDRNIAALQARVRASPDGRAPFVSLWPGGHRWAAILTHDVEGPAGVDNVLRVVELERRYGFVSAWNFVAEWYPIPDGLFDALRAAGCEIGLHGIRHDGLLFRNRERFEADLPRIADVLSEWGAVGFRSPATHRNPDWMAELPVEYDSSFPDTDPFEPMAGGCCSILPFFFGNVVELPITLVQDHTLFEILREPGIDRWVSKSEWIMRHHGLINVIVHPDYVVAPDRLARYEQFLAFLAAQSGGWHALPQDVARWWRQRATLRVGRTGEVEGTSDFTATVTVASQTSGGLVLDV
jgi:peptidoglycan/xylan/chitin deacetylase (PgdA/CDA1 family)